MPERTVKVGHQLEGIGMLHIAGKGYGSKLKATKNHRTLKNYFIALPLACHEKERKQINAHNTGRVLIFGFYF